MQISYSVWLLEYTFPLFFYFLCQGEGMFFLRFYNVYITLFTMYLKLQFIYNGLSQRWMIILMWEKYFLCLTCVLYGLVCWLPSFFFFFFLLFVQVVLLSNKSFMSFESLVCVGDLVFYLLSLESSFTCLPLLVVVIVCFKWEFLLFYSFPWLSALLGN